VITFSQTNNWPRKGFRFSTGEVVLAFEGEMSEDDIEKILDREMLL
jgi:hypothetical protein